MHQPVAYFLPKYILSSASVGLSNKQRISQFFEVQYHFKFSALGTHWWVFPARVNFEGRAFTAVSLYKVILRPHQNLDFWDIDQLIAFIQVNWVCRTCFARQRTTRRVKNPHHIAKVICPLFKRLIHSKQWPSYRKRFSGISLARRFCSTNQSKNA